jgi:hypothetical protein
MGTPPKKIRSARSKALEIKLRSTRLIKLSVEFHLPPEESVRGRLKLAYHATADKAEDGSTIAYLLIEGSGTDKSEPEREAFTISAEMMGLFDLSRELTTSELKGISNNLADYLIPSLTDLIEIAISKSGYPRIELPKTFPDQSAGV